MGIGYTLRIRTLTGLILLFCLSPVWAQSQPADVRLMIDVSGSMELTDPHNLRQPAVDLLVRLLPEGGKAGIWTFGDEVHNLVPHQVVDDAWREKARQRSDQINSVSLFTHIGAALEQAAYDRAQPNADYNTSIILLTDGMVDISRSPKVNQKEWRRVVDEVLPSIQKAGYKIFTVALSDLADTDLMKKIAIDTDGATAVVHNAEELTKVFLNAFDTAAPAQQVPLVDNRFLLDSSVQEFTALVFRENPAEYTRLISPVPESYDYLNTDEFIRWHRTDTYDLITVTHPYEGAWRVVAAMGPDSRITVVTRMNLRVRPLPNNLFLGAQETLQFMLQEDGAPLTDAAFLALMDIHAQLHRQTEDGGRELVWEQGFPARQVSKEGVFAQALPEFQQLGTYELSLRVDGTTFQRQFSHTMVVREPFSATLAEAWDEQGQPHSLLSVQSHTDRVLPRQTQLAVTIVGPDRRRIVRPLALTPQDRWQTPLYFEQAGEYQILVRVTGRDVDGDPFEYNLQPISHRHDPDAAFAPPAKVQPTPEPTPPPVVAEEPPIVEPSQDASPWLLYGLLALLNLALAAAGYWMYRKWVAEDEPAEAEAEAEAAVVAAEPEPDSMEMDFSDDDDVDDSDDEDEEEPPMEDLDLSDVQDAVAGADDFPEDDFAGEDMLDEKMAGEDAAPVDVEPAPEPLLEEDDDDDAGVSLEDELMQLVAGEATAEERDSFAEEMLKAQGLDLAESELDDAISNLINELDGGGADDETDGGAGGFEDDDMDMDMDMDMEDWDEDTDPDKPSKKS